MRPVIGSKLSPVGSEPCTIVQLLYLPEPPLAVNCWEYDTLSVAAGRRLLVATTTGLEDCGIAKALQKIATSNGFTERTQLA